MPGTKKDDFRFFDFNGEKVKDIRILPPFIDEEAEQQIYRTFRVPKEYLVKSIPDDGVPIGAMDRFIDPPPAMQGVTQIPCRPSGWSKFGFGCPFCEIYLNQYPEDRGEGGIE